MSDTFSTTIRRGIPWTRTFMVSIEGVPVDFTGYSAVARVANLTLGPGGVTTGADGSITLHVPGEMTALIQRSNVPITIDLIGPGGIALEPRIEGRAYVRD